MIDASEIAPGLYQGSRPPEGDALRRAGFRTLALCAREIQGGHYPGVRVVRCPLDDAELSGPEWSAAWRAAREVAAALPHGSVLVTCVQGRNRSGLVSALVLYLVFGVSSDTCVDLVRAGRDGDLARLGRGGALTNPSFARAIRALV